MVNIHTQESSTGNWIRALEIPLEDVQRLSLRPLKWLRFVAFAVFGAKGDLYDAPPETGSSIAGYETVSHSELADSYYFVPDGSYHLADPQGLTFHISDSSHSTPSPTATTFSESVTQRDGNYCVITRDDTCRASHIIPDFKGDEYIQFVVYDRKSLYDSEDQQSHLEGIGVHSIQNGILVSFGLHRQLHSGTSALLKTPNFALSPADIPRVESGEIPTSRTTLQRIRPYSETALFQVPQLDAMVDWSGTNDAPSNLLLDYMYGVSVIRHWATKDIREMLELRHENNYKKYTPPGLSRAMDTAFQFTALFKGYPPGTTWQEVRQRQEDEAEMHSRQVACDKVRVWLDSETGESLVSDRSDSRVDGRTSIDSSFWTRS